MTMELKTLFVGDNSADAEFQLAVLKASGIVCDARRVQTESDFRRELAEFVPDLIIADYSVPFFDGMSVLRMARSQLPDAPFIIVSDTIAEDQAVKLLDNGATDCVAKSNAPRFAQAVRRALREAENERHRRREEDKVARLSRIYAVLSGINSLIVRARTRDELLRGACKIATEKGNFGIAWIGLLDPKTAAIKPTAWAGVDAHGLDASASTALADVPQGQGVVGRAIREKRAVFTNDLTAEPTAGGKRRQEAIRRGYRSLIALPLMIADSVVGSLSLFAKERNFFNQDEFQLLSELAGNISLALAHFDKEEKIARLSRIHGVTSNINSLIVRVRDRQELFNEACRIAVEHGGFGIAWIGTLDPDTMKITPVAWSGLDSESFIACYRAQWTSALTERSLAGRAIREKQPVFNNDITADAASGGGVMRQEAIRRGYRSLISLPLLVHGAAVGNLSIFATEINFFTDDEVRLLTELARDISFALEYLEKEERINYLAYYDVLTGLPNRNLLNDRLKQAISASKRSGNMAAIAFVDLDQFKLINDSLGHNAGDQLLQAVAARLISCTREVDTVGRLGGDEFVLVLPEQTDVDITTGVMQRILEKVREPLRSGDHELNTACSIGVALFPQDGSAPETLLKHADAAMYRAKESGRNNFQFYATEMNVKINERLSLGSKLHRAIERHELFVHYQPQIDLRSGSIIGAEVLARWHNAEIGLVPAAKFIPLAEESDLILAIGEWVLGEACAQNKSWQDAGLPPISISVNVSARQFRRPDLHRIVARILHDTGLEAKYLRFELTETVVMHNVAAVISMMNNFAALGVELSIDDFGTGYSSLSYLKRFPVNRLKIDQSFVRDLADDPDDAAIAQSIISLGHSLGLKVVAEGVETEQQLAFLRARGCDEVQGYLFSKPLAAAEFGALLQSWRDPIAVST